MSGAAVDHSTDWRRPSPRRRAVAIGLTLAAELLFLMVLLGLNPNLSDKILPRSSPLRIDLSPPSPKPRKASPKPKPKSQVQPAEPAKVTPPPKVPPVPPSPLVALSRADMTAADPQCTAEARDLTWSGMPSLGVILAEPGRRTSVPSKRPGTGTTMWREKRGLIAPDPSTTR